MPFSTKGEKALLNSLPLTKLLAIPLQFFKVLKHFLDVVVAEEVEDGWVTGLFISLLNFLLRFVWRIFQYLLGRIHVVFFGLLSLIVLFETVFGSVDADIAKALIKVTRLRRHRNEHI